MKGTDAIIKVTGAFSDQRQKEQATTIDLYRKYIQERDEADSKTIKAREAEIVRLSDAVEHLRTEYNTIVVQNLRLSAENAEFKSKMSPKGGTDA